MHCGNCSLLIQQTQSWVNAIARSSFRLRVRPVSFVSGVVQVLLHCISNAILSSIASHTSLTSARLVLCCRHGRRHVGVPRITRIEIALARLAQRPPSTRHHGWQSRGWFQPGWAHVFELRLRTLHDGDSERVLGDVRELRLLQEYKYCDSGHVARLSFAMDSCRDLTVEF